MRRTVGGHDRPARRAASGATAHRLAADPPRTRANVPRQVGHDRQRGRSRHVRTGATRRYTSTMFERFTDRARRVVVLAQEEARLLNHSYIGTEHILLGLIHEGEGVAAKALESPRHLARGRAQPGRGDHRPGRLVAVGPHPVHARAPRRCSSCRCAKRCSSATTTSAPSTSCSASSVRARASPPRCSSSSAPTSAASASRSSSCSSGYQGSGSAGRGRAAGRRRAGVGGSARKTTPSDKGNSQILDQFGRNLTQLAREKKLDPVIGRTPRARAGHADPLAGAPRTTRC